LSRELVGEIREAVQTPGEDAHIGVIDITGGAGQSFCGGADLLLTAGVETMDQIERFTTLILAAVNSISVGGGCALALASRVRMGSDSTPIEQPEIDLGIVPECGGWDRNRERIGESCSLGWLLTGRMARVPEAYAAGLICRAVSDPQHVKSAGELAEQPAGKPRTGGGRMLRALRERSLYPESGKVPEAETFSEAAAGLDAAEGISALLQKRSPQFRGA
jgi:enoyl-CoA hydratase/carnithine racemase